MTVQLCACPRRRRTVTSFRILRTYPERKMTFVLYFNLDCLSECDEIVFVLKCLTVAFLSVCLMLFYRLVLKF